MNENRLDGPLKWCKDREAGLPIPTPVFAGSPSGEAEQPGPSRKFVAFVYLLRAGEFYKVGVARDVESRIAALQGGCPFSIKVHHVWPSYNPYRVERRLHFKLREFRTRGEWFKLPDEIVGKLLLVNNIHRY